MNNKEVLINVNENKTIWKWLDYEVKGNNKDCSSGCDGGGKRDKEERVWKSRMILGEEGIQK